MRAGGQQKRLAARADRGGGRGAERRPGHGVRVLRNVGERRGGRDHGAVPRAAQGGQAAEDDRVEGQAAEFRAASEARVQPDVEQNWEYVVVDPAM